MSGIKCVIYARYSSTKQDEISIDAQVRACKEYATNKDYVILKVYADEAISGKGTKTQSRKQYQALLRDSKLGLFDVVLVHRYDRIARNVGEHVNLELKLSENNISLVAVSQDFGQSKEAKIMKTMMWALSEYYIDNLADETKKGHKEVALKGLHNGGCPPFGYDIKNQRQLYIVRNSLVDMTKELLEGTSETERNKSILSYFSWSFPVNS
jgi:DNA invertase Pin-like site-specific DNA recombinase